MAERRGRKERKGEQFQDLQRKSKRRKKILEEAKPNQTNVPREEKMQARVGFVPAETLMIPVSTTGKGGGAGSKKGERNKDKKGIVRYQNEVSTELPKAEENAEKRSGEKKVRKRV